MIEEKINRLLLIFVLPIQKSLLSYVNRDVYQRNGLFPFWNIDQLGFIHCFHWDASVRSNHIKSLLSPPPSEMCDCDLCSFEASPANVWRLLLHAHTSVVALPAKEPNVGSCKADDGNPPWPPWRPDQYLDSVYRDCAAFNACQWPLEAFTVNVIAWVFSSVGTWEIPPKGQWEALVLGRKLSSSGSDRWREESCVAE